jgi:hypothetical protein
MIKNKTNKDKKVSIAEKDRKSNQISRLINKLSPRNWIYKRRIFKKLNLHILKIKQSK